MGIIFEVSSDECLDSNDDSSVDFSDILCTKFPNIFDNLLGIILPTTFDFKCDKCDDLNDDSSNNFP